MKIIDTSRGLFKQTYETYEKGTLSSTFFILISPLLSLIPGILVGLSMSGTIGYNELSLKYFFQFNLLQYTSGAIIVYYIIAEYKEKRSFATLGLTMNKKAPFQYLKGFIIGITMMTIITLIIVLSGSGQISLPKHSIGWSFLYGYIYTLISWTVLAASQEVMVRGYMMPSLAVKKGALFSIILTSIYFGCMHLTGKGVTLLAIINLTIFGLFTCVYAIYEEDIWGACAFHSAWNFAQGNIFGFIVSGDVTKGGSIFTTKLTTINLINGGAFGPEAGLGVTITLIISLLITILLLVRKIKREIN